MMIVKTLPAFARVDGGCLQKNDSDDDSDAPYSHENCGPVKRRKEWAINVESATNRTCCFQKKKTVWEHDLDCCATETWMELQEEKLDDSVHGCSCCDYCWNWSCCCGCFVSV